MGVPASLRKALSEVVKAAGANTDAAKLAQSLQPLLERAVEELVADSVVRRSKRGTGRIEYVVERTQQGEVLSETRLGGRSKPFRCPKNVYDALAAILDEADRPLALDEIMAAVEARMGDRPADHQVRVALRLWLHVAVVTRNRARYRALTASFEVTGTELWMRLQFYRDNAAQQP